MFIETKRHDYFCDSRNSKNCLRALLDQLEIDYVEIEHYGIKVLKKRYIIPDGQFRLMRQYDIKFKLID